MKLRVRKSERERGGEGVREGKRGEAAAAAAAADAVGDGAWGHWIGHGVVLV